MSPKTGRPIVGKEPKNKQIALRATETTVKKFTECAQITGRTKTDLLEEMVDELHDNLTKAKKIKCWRPTNHTNTLYHHTAKRRVNLLCPPFWCMSMRR